MKGILFLGTSLLGAQYLADTVLMMGYRPIFLLDIDDYSGDPRRSIEKCEYYKANLNSLDDLCTVIEENRLMDRAVAVTSLLDETLQHACAIAKKFKMIGPDIALNKLIDKAMVREMIPEFSPPSITFDRSNFSEERINQFFEANKSFSEFLLKPGISSGAVGISLLCNIEINADKIKQMIDESPIQDAKQQNWVIQPRVTGSLYSLEGFVQNGHATFLGFSRRTRKSLTESTTTFPVDQDIPEHLQRRCQIAVEALVQRSGYLNGYFHSEFIINAESVYFIDGNMGRIAGGAIVQQIALVYGKKPVDIYQHVFDLGLFNGAKTQGFSYKKGSEKSTLSINYCLAEAATVLGVTVPHDLVSLHTQIVDNGKAMPGVGTSDSAWVGFLAGFKDVVLDEIQKLIVQTNKGPVSPFYTLNEHSLTKQALSTPGEHP